MTKKYSYRFFAALLLCATVSCSKKSSDSLINDPLLRLVPKDAIAFLFVDYSLPASKKFRASPAMKNSATQIEEQVAKLRELDPKLAEAMQSVMKAIPGNITAVDSSIEKMLAYYRPDSNNADSPNDVAVRVSFSNERDPFQLLENIQKGMLSGITATKDGELLKIQAAQPQSSPIVFYLCKDNSIIVAAINKTTCSGLLAAPPASIELSPVVTSLPKEVLKDTSTLIGGVSITNLLTQPLDPSSSLAIPKESPIQYAYFISGFDGAITGNIELILNKEDPQVTSVLNQFSEFSNSKISHRVPDSSPFAFSLHLPSGLSADLSMLLSMTAPSLKDVVVKSIACGVFENPEASIPAIGCAVESKDGNVLAASIKSQAVELLKSQTGAAATWQEEITDGIATSTFMTPFGFGLSIGARKELTLVGSTLDAIKEIDHGKVTKAPIGASDPLYAHLHGVNLRQLIQNALESAKLFGVDTATYEDALKGLMTYTDVYVGAKVQNGRISLTSVAHLKE